MAGDAMNKAILTCALPMLALLSACDMGGGNAASNNGAAQGDLAGARIGGPFTLTDQDGKQVRWDDFKGQYRLVYFGYTYCPDVCPTELTQISAALDRLGPDAQKIQPIFITVDPERDTPEAMADYVKNFYPTLIGLTGTQQEIDSVVSAYRVFARKVQEPNSNQYVMDHSTFIYLMGPDGNFLTMYRYGTEPDALAQSLKSYVDPT